MIKCLYKGARKAPGCFTHENGEWLSNTGSPEERQDSVKKAAHWVSSVIAVDALHPCTRRSPYQPQVQRVRVPWSRGHHRKGIVC